MGMCSQLNSGVRESLSSDTAQSGICAKGFDPPIVVHDWFERWGAYSMRSTTSLSAQPVNAELPPLHMFSEERDSGFSPSAPGQAGRELREAASRFEFG